MPGEARLATHPTRFVLWASLWLALACNVAVWRLLGGELGSLRTTLASVAILGGGSGILFSLLAWRRTLKPAITIALIAAALVACGMWTQQLPVEALWRQSPGTLLPSWADFMRWQVLALVLVLAVVPIVTVWNVAMRRLPGPAQFRASIAGMIVAGLVLGAGIYAA